MADNIEKDINKTNEEQIESDEEITTSARKNIYALSSAAFFNDTGSDMLTPAYSNFMISVIGAPQWIIGLLDAMSLLAGALLRPISGKISDRKGRKIFIWIGYIFLMISRGTQALARVWSHLIAPKFIYEFGRGMRNPAREALITEEMPVKKRGWAFGLLQTADSTGAILGPTIGYLLWNVFRHVFYWDIAFSSRILIAIAAAPTILSVLIVLIFVRDQKKLKKSDEKQLNLDEKINNSRVADQKLTNIDFPEKKAFIFLTILFVILFLGIPTETLILSMPMERYPQYPQDIAFVLFFFFNVFYAIAAYPAGVASDKFGARTMFIISTSLLILFGILSATNINGSLYLTIPSLIIFGLFKGSIFPPMMKLIAGVVPSHRRAELLGTFSMFKAGSEIASPLILGGLFSISIYTQFIPYVLISIFGSIALFMMIFSPKIMKTK